jgi:hypothetical protein
MNLDASLYTLLQVLSLTLFEKMPLQQAIQANDYTSNQGGACNQLNLFKPIREIPRLCRGGSRSLTFAGVHR